MFCKLGAEARRCLSAGEGAEKLSTPSTPAPAGSYSLTGERKQMCRQAWALPRAQRAVPGRERWERAGLGWEELDLEGRGLSCGLSC